MTHASSRAARDVGAARYPGSSLHPDRMPEPAHCQWPAEEPHAASRAQTLQPIRAPPARRADLFRMTQPRHHRPHAPIGGRFESLSHPAAACRPSAPLQGATTIDLEHLARVPELEHAVPGAMRVRRLRKQSDVRTSPELRTTRHSRLRRESTPDGMPPSRPASSNPAGRPPQPAPRTGDRSPVATNTVRVFSIYSQ